MTATTIVNVLGLGTGGLAANKNGIELNVKVGDDSFLRLTGPREVMQQLAMALTSLLGKLDQFNPDKMLTGETVTVTTVEATDVLVGSSEDGRIAIRFESKGMAPTVLLERDLAKAMITLTEGQLRSKQGPAKPQ